MLTTLANPILPIFAILALGYGLHRFGLFDVPTAQAINRFVFFVATPALVFSIIANAPITHFNLAALGAYFSAQLIIYISTSIFMYRVLNRDRAESLLLGMTATFVNHVFFVLPIAERIYGVNASQPIAGIILIDSGLVFCGTVLAVDLMQTKNPSPLKVVGMLIRNPFLIASVLGILAWWLRPLIPQGFFTYASFAGAAAAPTSLFALGIVLASNSIRPIGAATWSIIFAKIALHPLLVFCMLSLVSVSSDWKTMLILVAAGPCGAMPFVIALQYGITTKTIAKAVLVSTLFSLISLSLLTV